MNTLAIDIGGTKFSLALFDDGRLVRRESRATSSEGGRDWMLAQLAALIPAWQASAPIARCGIGFGGPVLFDRQRVAPLHPRRRLERFRPPRLDHRPIRLPRHHG